MRKSRENMNAHPCPNCGHCPTCGRGGWGTSPLPYYPWTPTWPVGTIWVTGAGNTTWQVTGNTGTNVL